MINKKGFTLIEILSVIIILGIIMLIAFPAVNSYLEKSNRGAYSADVQAYVETVKSEYEMKDYGELLDDGEIMIVPIEHIKLEKGTAESPYAPYDLTRSYVLIVPERNGYQFYSYVVDETGVGIWGKASNELNREAVEEDFELDDILPVEAYKSAAYKYTYNDKEYTKCEIRNIETIEKVVSNAVIVLCDRDSLYDYSDDGGYDWHGAVCVPATTLHTATCSRNSSDGCGAIIGMGNQITYGTLVSGRVKAGDAFDCDVNDDGIYDPLTERFYYVTSNGDNSILIYYKNTTDQLTYPYDSSGENWHGPRDAKEYLPSTSSWKNPYLIVQQERNILTQNDRNSTEGGTIDSFSYGGKAARFLTYQEVKSVCGDTGITDYGYLDKCNYFMENIGQYETESGSYGYWLETPKYGSSSTVWRMSCRVRIMFYGESDAAIYFGIRPAITIPTSKLG